MSVCAAHERRLLRWASTALSLVLCACDVVLVDAATPDEARNMVEALDAAGIGSTLSTTRNTRDNNAHAQAISVSPSDVARAHAALLSGTPSGSRDDASDALPAQDATLFSSRTDEQARQARTMAHDLARSIELLPGVEHARVHLGVWLGPEYARALAPSPKASVLVRESFSNADANALDPSAVQKLVAAAVPGLSVDAVQVTRVKRTALPRAVRLERVGAFTVSADSAPRLRASLAAGLSVQAALAILLIVVLVRARRRARTASTDDLRDS